jgi:hypothetical protein
MKTFYLVIFFIFSISHLQAQTLEEGAWTDFIGTIGNKACQLSLYLFKDSTIKGNYVFKYDSLKQNLSGFLKGTDFLLKEDNHKNISFKGKAITDPADELRGARTDGLKNQDVPFGFLSISSNWGDYGHRYATAGGTEDEVERFMRMARHAILSGNKQWIANHIQYPVRHVLKKRYQLVKNKQLFIKYFDRIFTQRFKDKVREDYTTNLFTKYDSVMLGNGEIWVSGNSNAKDKKSGFIIIAINN